MPLHKDAKLVFPAGRCIPYRYVKERYYPFGNTPMVDFLRHINWKEERRQVLNPSILTLGSGDIRFCIRTLVDNFHPSFCGNKRLNGISFRLNDRCNCIHARNVLFLHILLKNAGTHPKNWIPSLWSIWYCHELLPQHVDVLQDHVTDLLSLSETADKWTNSKALICRLCNFEEDTLVGIRNIWKLWLKRLCGKPPTTIEAVKSKRDKCLIRAGHIQHLREIVHRLTNHTICTDAANDAIAADYYMYLKEGSAYAEMVGAFAEIAAQRVLNPTFFEENGTYNMCSFVTPYSSFLQMNVWSDINLSHWYPDMKGVWFVDNKGLQNYPLLGNSVQQFTVFFAAAASILTSGQNEEIKFYFNNLDAVMYCQKLSNEGSKFDCVDSSNLIDYLSPLVLVVAAMPLVAEGGSMLSSTMLYHDVANCVERYLPNMFGFDPELIPTMFGIRYSLNEQVPTIFDTRPIEWRNDESTQPLKIDSLQLRPDIVDALVGLAKVTTTSEKLFHEFRASAETAVLSYCFFASNLHHDAPIGTYQFWDSLCVRLRKDNEMQKYLLHIQTQALLHNLHFHLVISTDQCPLCSQQALPIDHVAINFEPIENIIGNEGLLVRFDESYSMVQL